MKDVASRIQYARIARALLAIWALWGFGVDIWEWFISADSLTQAACIIIACTIRIVIGLMIRPPISRRPSSVAHSVARMVNRQLAGDERTLVSRHEARHAVVAQALGLRVMSISLIRERDSLARTTTAGTEGVYDTPSSARFALATVRLASSGVAAVGPQGDETEALSLLMQTIAGEDKTPFTNQTTLEGLMQDAYQLAHAICADNEAVIEQLVIALNDTDELADEKLTSILDQVVMPSTHTHTQGRPRIAPGEGPDGPAASRRPSP